MKSIFRLTIAALFLALVPPALAGSVTVGWIAPTENIDETPAVLSGFEIDYQVTSGGALQTITITDPAARSHVIDGVDPGAAVIVSMRAVGDDGQESELSNIVQFTSSGAPTPGSPPNPPVVIDPTAALPATTSPVLSIAPGGRYLRLDGQPFFYVADTGWLAAWSLTPAEITQYLEDRAAKGVRVIQGPIIGLSLVLPPYDGGADDPFIDTAPMTLNAAWWVKADHMVAEAARLRMVIALAPVWGSDNDIIFPDAARHVEFVTLIAKRYANQAHVLYIAAGEYDKITDDGFTTNNRPLTVAEVERYNAVTGAIRANAHPQALITYHPDGWNQPSIDFGADSRVQINMLQSSSSLHENVRRVPIERASILTKPVIEAEIGYENATNNPWRQRVPAYQTLMQGGAGFAYGHDLIWNFSPGWQDAMQAEGGIDVMINFRRFAGMIHAEDNEPAQELVLTPGEIADAGNSYATALRSADRSKLHAFVSNGRTFNLNLQDMAAGDLSARWGDPRDGTYSAPFPITRSADAVMDPPDSPAQGNDWLLSVTSGAASGAGVLSLSTTREGTDPPGSAFVPDANLDQLGPLGWIRTGETSPTSENKKTGSFSNPVRSEIGAPVWFQYAVATDRQAPLAIYTGGANPVTGSSRSWNGNLTAGAGSRFVIPLGGQNLNVTIGTGGYNSISRLSVTVSDGSAAAVTTDLDTGAGGVGWWRTVIVAQAASPTATLAIDYTLVSGVNAQTQWVAVSAGN